MALSLLDGSNTNIDVVIDSNSWRCWTNSWVARITRDFFEATTFCDSGWRKRTPGFKQLLGTIGGFGAKGAAGTNPVSLFSSNVARPFVLTADTGCTFTFDGHAQENAIGFGAAQNSSQGLAWESYGVVTTAWVVT